MSSKSKDSYTTTNGGSGSGTAAAPPATTAKRKKFLGGAEQARRRAQKKKRRGIAITRPNEQVRLNSQLPRSMPSMERFFAALLRSPASEFVSVAASTPKNSNSNSSSSSSINTTTVWEAACQRLGLSVLPHPLAPNYGNPTTHFAARASLVLEEACHAIAEGLQWHHCHWKNTNANANNTTATGHKKKHHCKTTMHVRLDACEAIASSQHSKWTFAAANDRQPFTKEQLFELRPGTVLQCIPKDAKPSIQQVTLAVVWSGNREMVETNQRFQVLVCRENVAAALHDEWIVAPLASLITDLRCFEALTSPRKVAFLDALLGGKGRTHTRFDDEGQAVELLDEGTDDDDNDNNNKKNEGTVPITATTSTMFRMPTLNQTQLKAANSFLNASPGTITLVQGPPGTGKTTLLVSMICQYFLQHQQQHDEGSSRRLLVCAPTNKAVSVLASRFCAALDADAAMNVLLVGDGEKLLTDSRHATVATTNTASTSRPLETTFLYTWMTTLTTEYKQIRDVVAKGRRQDDLSTRARRLQTRLTTGLPRLSKDLVTSANEITAAMQQQQFTTANLVQKLDTFIQQLQDLPTDFVWKELMASAHVIFSTLATSGGMVFRNTTPVDDLIVDEAAAATEPELYIPFHLRPRRLLAVGDPKQLPATVLSQRATALGLSKSLHERLMYDCDIPYTLLDVQYRMHPEIALFPAHHFYQSKIDNGPNVLGARQQRGAALMDGKPYSFLQVNGLEEKGPGGSHRNPAEAQTVVDLVCQLRRQQRQRDPKWYSSDCIRVITFYQAQVTLIKQLLYKEKLGHKVVVATVDSSQGCEADIVLVSFVRSPPSHRTSLTRYDAGFLTDDRRMNVALTRAKYQCIGIGNATALQQMAGAETLQRLAHDAMERKVVRPYLTSRDTIMQENLEVFCDDPPSKRVKKEP